MDQTIVSLHAHNDQGCAVAATELALLAGATRVEGTIFGHGERTGNLDLAILALNFQSRGIETNLSFDNLPEIVRIVEESSGIEVHPRHPYAGQLVFTAFSGSHQDAIRKGMENRKNIGEYFKHGWKVPYLHIDPADVGSSYEKLIRINSQSGKGGIVYILEKEFGIFPPKAMHPTIGREIQEYMDKAGGEIDSATLKKLFYERFVNISGPFKMLDYRRDVLGANTGDQIKVCFTLDCNGHCAELSAEGNGPIAAVVNALLSSVLVPRFELVDFSERTLGSSASAMAMAFVGIRFACNRMVYGVGVHSNIDRAALAALFSALNRSVVKQ